MRRGTEASVAAGMFRGLLDYAVAQGMDRAALMQASQVTEVGLADQDARVPMPCYRALIDTCCTQSGDGAFHIRFSLGTQLEQMSIVGLIVHSAPSMAASLQQLNRYARLMVEVDVMPEGDRFAVEPGPEGVWIIDTRPDPDSFPALSELAFARFVGEFRRSFPDRPFARAIEFTFPEPDHATDYPALYQVPVTCGAVRNALCIDPTWLTTPFEGASGYVFGIFAERADALLAELAKDSSTRARVEAELMPILHDGSASIETVAARLGMSRQTLYRRLKDEGTSFASVLDDLRHRMAADYLRARKVSVNQTAYLVGFSEPSSFVRAFKRWTGQTPSAFQSAAVAV